MIKEFLKKFIGKLVNRKFFDLIKSSSKIVWKRILRDISNHGILYFLESVFRLFQNYEYIPLWINNYNRYWTWFYRNFKETRKFKFQGRKYRYFYHSYSITWNNERSIEIPIIYNIVKEHFKKEILEVGNVLSHFFNFKHDIVDKYEKAPKVINQDIVDYNPSKKYDLIISISTLEHVGWDEEPKEPYKILKAIRRLKQLVKKNGKIIITLPKGHSPVLDNLLDKNKLSFSKKFFMKKITRNNKWKQVSWNQISDEIYGYPVKYSANGLIIGLILGND